MGYFNTFLITGIFLTSIEYPAAAESKIGLNSYQQDLQAVPCIVQIVKKYLFSQKENISSIVVIDFPPKISSFSNILAKSITENYSATIVTEFANDLGYLITNWGFVFKSTSYFLRINATWEVEPIVRHWKSLSSWNPMAKVLVLMYFTYDVSIIKDKQKEVFSVFLDYNMLNVKIIAYRNMTQKLDVVTWYPFKNGNCAAIVTNIEMIGKCEYDNDTIRFTDYPTTDEVIPKYIPGCKLRIATSIQEPYVYYNQTTKILTGMEVILVKAIAAKMGMIPEFIIIKEVRSNRVVDNKTGIYSLLLQRQADLLIGGLDNDEKVNDLLGETISYISDDQTWCVHKALPYKTWENIFALFTWPMWLLMIGFTAIIAIFLYILLKNNDTSPLQNNFSYALLVSFASFLNMSPSFKAHKNSLKILFFCAMVYGIIFSAIFSCSLISVLTQPRDGFQVKSIGSAYANGFRFTTGNVAISHVQASDDENAALILQRLTFCPHIEVCLMRIRDDLKLAVGVSRQHALNNPRLHRRSIFCFPRSSNIYTYSVLMQSRQDFYLLHHINIIIARLVEHGLVYSWMEISQNYTVISTSMRLSKEDESPLTVNHVLGAIVILAVGLLLAILVFVLEVLEISADFF